MRIANITRNKNLTPKSHNTFPQLSPEFKHSGKPKNANRVSSLQFETRGFRDAACVPGFTDCTDTRVHPLKPNPTSAVDGGRRWSVGLPDRVMYDGICLLQWPVWNIHHRQTSGGAGWSNTHIKMCLYTQVLNLCCWPSFPWSKIATRHTWEVQTRIFFETSLTAWF